MEYTWMSEATQGMESVVAVTFEPRGDQTACNACGIPESQTTKWDAGTRKAGPGSFDAR